MESDCLSDDVDFMDLVLIGTRTSQLLQGRYGMHSRTSQDNDNANITPTPVDGSRLLLQRLRIQLNKEMEDDILVLLQISRFTKRE
jgi:hypothetical protein